MAAQVVKRLPEGDDWTYELKFRWLPGADHQAHGGESRNALSRLVANEVVDLEPTRRVSSGRAEEGPN
jgi:hypothetical protein